MADEYLEGIMSRSEMRRPTPLQNPTQYASGYSLDLYCDHTNGLHDFQEFPHSFSGETFWQCARKARTHGWVIRTETRTATCPMCSGKRTGRDVGTRGVTK